MDRTLTRRSRPHPLPLFSALPSPHHRPSSPTINGSLIPSPACDSTPPQQAARMLRRFVDGRRAGPPDLRISWLSTVVDGRWSRVHGGVKFYRGAAAAARTTSRPTAPGPTTTTWPRAAAWRQRLRRRAPGDVQSSASRHGRRRPTSSGSPGTTSRPAQPKGRLRNDDQAVRFVEVVVNGPKTWSLAAALHPEIAAAYDAAQDRRGRGDHRLARRARHHPGRAAGPAGAGAGRADRGRGRAALHLPGR